MAGSSLSGDDEPISGINVTPLVDVVLVLLVIFMITAPVIYQSAIKVQLPKASSGEKGGSESPLQFSISREGELGLNGKKLSWDEAEGQIKAVKDPANQTISLSADQATPHGTVIRLMDLMRKYGLTRFALQVEGIR
jgi:biopolymer transport protein ExbD